MDSPRLSKGPTGLLLSPVTSRVPPRPRQPRITAYPTSTRTLRLPGTTTSSPAQGPPGHRHVLPGTTSSQVPRSLQPRVLIRHRHGLPGPTPSLPPGPATSSTASGPSQPRDLPNPRLPKPGPREGRGKRSRTRRAPSRRGPFVNPPGSLSSYRKEERFLTPTSRSSSHHSHLTAYDFTNCVAVL